MSWKVCTSEETRGSVQHQTVLVLYDQEMIEAMPSCQRLKTMVRRHIDQMNRTRNLEARNERIETGVFVKSHKGRKISVERKVGECYQWKATGQCSRGDSCSFSHGQASGNRRDRGQKAQWSSPARKARTQTDGGKPSKGSGLRGDSFSGKKGRKAGHKFPQRKVWWIRRLILGILPYVKIPSLNRDANTATNVCSDVLRLMGGRVKSRRKVVERISCHTKGVCTIGLCVSRLLSEKSLFCGNLGNWDRITPSNSRALDTTFKIGNERVHR